MNIWIDGSPALRQNQQGRIAVVDENGKTFVSEEGPCTNNEAEYLALIEAFRKCNDGDVINTDSEFVFGHLTKEWKVRAENLKELYQKARALPEQKSCKTGLIPRKNYKAGKLLEGMTGYKHPRTR